MDVEQEATQILNRLGLTNSQVRVYLTLLKLGKTTAKTISNNSRVARQEVYRVLVELEEKSLVERIIAVPTEFKAVPIEDCLSFLIMERKKEISELQKESTKLSSKLTFFLKSREKKVKTPQIGKTEFVLVPESKALLLRMEKALASTQNSIEAIYPKDMFLQILFNLSDKFKKALDRGVKIRCLINEQLDTNSWPLAVQTIVENRFFEIRILLEIPFENFWIYDEKEVLVATSSTGNNKQFPVLWTTAAPLIGIAKKYFSTMWKKAAEDEIKK